MHKSHKFFGKWILAGTIIFKKKCNAQVNLEEIRLQWHGKSLEHLQGSLFIAKNSEPFKPINDNHVSDGKWGKKTQRLNFKFNHTISLHPTTIFYLVLTIPEEHVHALKGHFTIIPSCLPTPFQQEANKDPLAISIDVIDSTTH